MIKKSSILCLFVSLLSFAWRPGNVLAIDKSSELDRLFNYYHEVGMFNGAVLAAENGRVIYSQTFGFSDFENKTSLSPSSVFCIGSVTKPFTALAVMILKERGKLSYDDKLTKYFPEFEVYARDVSLRHLLTHTSGMPDYANDLKMQLQHPVLTNALVFDALVRQPALKFKAGEKYAYSNSGYFLLAMVIEKVSGKKYGEFLAENIFRPLGMDHTFAYDETMAVIPNRVNGYENIWQKRDEYLQWKVAGNGNIYSIAHDLWLFDQALYKETLVRQSTLREAYDTTRLIANNRNGRKYGFGWHILGDSGQVVYHRGGLEGFRCQYWRNLEKHDALIILGNNTWLSSCPDILTGAENIMLGKPYTLAKQDVTVLFFEHWYLKGYEPALRNLLEAKAKARTQYEFSEQSINDLGYSFMNRGEFRKAVEIFKLNVELFPESANVYDSLGEAYMKSGDTKQAIIHYEKSLKLDPQNTGAMEILKKLREGDTVLDPRGDLPGAWMPAGGYL